jgi:hypothetical protein
MKKDVNGKKTATTDLTIIPFEYNMVIYIGFRDGIKTKFGSIPEISFRRID